MTTSEQQTLTGEKADILAVLARHRNFLKHTVQGLTDEQAGQRTTVSELCLGGLIKHVAATEYGWINFVLGGAEAMMSGLRDDWANGFRMVEGETLAGLLAHFDEVAARTSEVVANLADLDGSHPLPEAPWFEQGASWSDRRVLLHLIAETSQHAGHADILREAIDGQKSMG